MTKAQNTSTPAVISVRAVPLVICRSSAGDSAFERDITPHGDSVSTPNGDYFKPAAPSPESGSEGTGYARRLALAAVRDFAMRP